MNRKRILLGFKSVPYPLRSDGVSVRYLPIIEYLGRRHDVDLLVFRGKEEEARNLEGIRPSCRKIYMLPGPRQVRYGFLTKCRTFGRFLLPWTPPYAFVTHEGSRVAREIAAALRDERYDALVWAGTFQLTSLMDALPSISADRTYVDFIDSPSLLAARRKEKVFRSGVLERYELWKTGRWEAGIIGRTDGAIYISGLDARVVPCRNAPMERRHVVPNGINKPPAGIAESIPLPSPNIGFLGNLGYRPNVEAVEWLYEHVFAPLRKTRPGLTLVVIGRNPSGSILELGKNPGVIVTGEVADIWGYVRSIDVFLFPLLRGAGLKNKILEAMFGERPVVTTEIGNEGIDGIPGKDIVLCRTPDEFQRETLRLLDSPEERRRIGMSAAGFVEDRFSWDRILPEYENLVLGTVPEFNPAGISGTDAPADRPTER